MTKRLKAVIVTLSLAAALFVVAGALGVKASDKDEIGRASCRERV